MLSQGRRQLLDETYLNLFTTMPFPLRRKTLYGAACFAFSEI
jgi:hypothetical protein